MKIAIITGSSRGLGRSTALNCARRGAGVIVTYNSHPDGADEVVRAIEAEGGKAVALKLDVSDAASFPASGTRWPRRCRRRGTVPTSIIWSTTRATASTTRSRP